MAASAGLLVSCPAASAAVTLTVRVVRGGLDLDLGTVAPGEPSRTEELELAIASSGGSPYRVYQEFDALTNERGGRLPDDAVVMQLSQGFTGTRSAGGVLPVAPHSQELFVSDPNGTSDTVVVAYAIPAHRALPAGSYRGVVRFSVEAAGGAVDTQTLTVRAEVAAAVRLEWSGAGPRRLELGEVEPGQRSAEAELLVTVVNNTASPTQLTQELAEPLTNERGDTFSPDAIASSVSSPQGSSPWQPLGTTPQLLVTDERGGGLVRAAYAAAIPPEQPAGRYRGTLRVRLMQLGVPSSDELLLPVELLVREVFTMTVTSPDGAGEALRFRTESGAGRPEAQRLIVEIRTNLGQPYQVLVGLDHSLVLDTGEQLPADALVCTLHDPQRGTIMAAPDTPLAIGYTPLYASDSRGSPDRFTLSCGLRVPPDAKAGSYGGRLRFTITMF
ncbi:MAG: hypothetical protein HYT90_01595 [Candidatus Omnitrophica bacterium]|nr:hypothetical protein [Candidatus Omnitrophota bacterium]